MPGPWVITAAGLISAAGDHPDALFSRLLEARSVATDSSDSVPFAAAPILGFDPSSYLRRKGVKHLSRTSQLACAAAGKLQDDLRDRNDTEVGVVLGTGWSSLDTIVRFEHEAHTVGPRFVDPSLFAETVANVPAGQMSIFFGWSAHNVTVAAGPTSGLEALLCAAEFLDEGRASLIVAGGGDELNFHMLRTLQADGLASRSAASLPLAPDSSGPIGGEGACLFALEAERSAASRGARVLGTLRGGTSRPVEAAGEPGVKQRADLIRRLLDDVGIGADEVGLLVLSANAERAGDLREAAVLVDVFGKAMPPALAPKAVLGETWGAAGSLAVAAALQSIQRRVVPPAPPPTAAGGRELGLNLPTEAQPLQVDCALILDGAGSSRFAAVVLTR